MDCSMPRFPDLHYPLEFAQIHIHWVRNVIGKVPGVSGLAVQFSSVQFSCSVVYDSATPWITARQASLSITNSRSLLRLMSIESVVPSSHLILCRPLFLLPPIPPSIRVFSNESTLHMKWPKYWKQSGCELDLVVGMVGSEQIFSKLHV